MRTSLPHVTIVILNWNREADTLECLESLARLDYPSFSIVVVDNGSTDGSPDVIERWGRENLPLALIRNAENRGFVRGSNQGVRHALANGTDYAFLLNNDTVAEPDALSLLVAAAERSDDIGMVGPKIYQYGKDNMLDSAGTRTIPWLAQGFLLGHGEEDHGRYDNPRDMPYVTGTALLVKRTVLEKVGPMDEDYFCYFDDFDWGLRARKAGFRLLLEPKAVVRHKGSRTAGFNSPFYIHHMVRSRILFARKHVSFPAFLFAFLPYLFLYRYLRPAAILIFRRRWGHLRALHRGIREGLKFPTN
ncbi:MAG: glycosyltransferase family 2 protein [Gemmatimonadetes bacterium]|nr:glycosyltransferase family 2 protein [Gemmatimonadota bacterium]